MKIVNYELHMTVIVNLKNGRLFYLLATTLIILAYEDCGEALLQFIVRMTQTLTRNFD